MASILIRTLIIYILLSFSLRIMGKRQIGELDISELVSTLLISEIASIPIDDPDIPLMNAIIPILFILSIEVILSTIKNKCERLKNAIEGKPAYIIYKGRLLQSTMKENRISVNELLSKLRAQGVGDISSVKYATIEQNGVLSVIKKDDGRMAHPIIIDGTPLHEVISAEGYDEKWLKQRLSQSGRKIDEIFLMTVDDNGKINIIIKED